MRPHRADARRQNHRPGLAQGPGKRRPSPHPLYEISGPVGASKAWVAQAAKEPWRGRDQDLRHALAPQHQEQGRSEAVLRRKPPKGFKGRQILPSLEDVFIKMVEVEEKMS